MQVWSRGTLSVLLVDSRNGELGQPLSNTIMETNEQDPHETDDSFEEEGANESAFEAFSELGLRSDIVEGVVELGFDRPSEIQKLSIPIVLEGHDLVGLSQTGSGKTAAFGLPIIQQIDFESREVQILVLCPTRELAKQVADELPRLASGLRQLRTIAVYGGASMETQIKAIRRGAQIVVGTPGRLLDLMRRGALRLDRVQRLVLDEADRMLDMGFRDEVEEILAAVNPDRQALFFSATMNRGVERLIRTYAQDPQIVQVEGQSRTADSIEQSHYLVSWQSRVEVLARIIEIDAPRLALVFANQKRVVDEIADEFLARGFKADRLHGDISQMGRERVLRRFKRGEIDLLIATDVAARGLDIDEIDLVVNYELPPDPDDYVHRIGRTGRAGRQGNAILFVAKNKRDFDRLRRIEHATDQRIERKMIPSPDKVKTSRVDRLFDEIKKRLEDTNEPPDRRAFLDRLLAEGHAPEAVSGILFSLLREATGRTNEYIREDRHGQTDNSYQRNEHPRPPQQNREREPRREQPAPRREREHDDRPAAPPRPEGRDRPERNDRRDDRGARPAPTGNRGGKVRLFLNLGKTSGVSPGAIAGMIYSESGIPNGAVGRIEFFPNHTIINVPAEFAEKILSSVQKASLNGQSFRMDYDDRS